MSSVRNRESLEAIEREVAAALSRLGPQNTLLKRKAARCLLQLVVQAGRLAKGVERGG